VVPGELFAKVVETLPEDLCRVVVSFTSIPEAARMFLDTVPDPGNRAGVADAMIEAAKHLPGSCPSAQDVGSFCR
jgi:hypothetical protein